MENGAYVALNNHYESIEWQLSSLKLLTIQTRIRMPVLITVGPIKEADANKDSHHCQTLT